MSRAFDREQRDLHGAELSLALVYDVGMHRGEDTAFYLKKGLTVVAIEANPELVAHCKIRFAEAIAQGQLHIVEGAIAPASANGKVAFYRNPVSVWGTIDDAWAERDARLGYQSHKIEVSVLDAVEIYRSYGIPFYLKVDIEGADLLMLDALRRFDARPQYVSIESEKIEFAKLEAEMRLLRDLGYTKFKPVQQRNIPGTRIRTRAIDGREIEHVFEPDASGPFGDDLPGPWLSFEEALQEYRVIFDRYRLFGDHSRVQRLPAIARKAVKALYQLGTGHRGPLPGWYDTHASL